MVLHVRNFTSPFSRKKKKRFCYISLKTCRLQTTRAITNCHVYVISFFVFFLTQPIPGGTSSPLFYLATHYIKRQHFHSTPRNGANASQVFESSPSEAVCSSCVSSGTTAAGCRTGRRGAHCPHRAPACFSSSP